MVIINVHGEELEFENQAIIDNINRLTNRIFKLLPSREEGGDWRTPLNNIILEVTGMKFLWCDQPRLFTLLCKLETLSSLDSENDFLVFRKLIFECLSILNDIKKCLH